MAKLNLNPALPNFAATQALENVARQIGAIESTKNQIRVLTGQLDTGIIVRGDRTIIMDDAGRRRVNQKIQELAGSLRDEFGGITTEEVIARVTGG
jgi:hypothetical protein